MLMKKKRKMVGGEAAASSNIEGQGLLQAIVGFLTIENQTSNV